MVQDTKIADFKILVRTNFSEVCVVITSKTNLLQIPIVDKFYVSEFYLA